MRISLTILFFLLSLFGLVRNNAAQSDSGEESIESLTLEQDSLTYCPYRVVENCTKNKPLIKVSTIVKNNKDKDLKFHYFVTGGKIIGEGANIVWDFNGEKPGKYSVTVGIGKESVIKGKTITRTLDFSYCPLCDLCECPAIVRILGPVYPIKAGDAAILTAEVKGGTQKRFQYYWNLSDGTSNNIKPTKAKIEFGQGTRHIIVRTDKSMKGQKIIVTVELGGVCPTCSNVAVFEIKIDK